MDVFDEFAAYYDLLYLDKDYTIESKFIHSLICEHYSKDDNTNEGRILELGCGTGKHAAVLASLGYKVTGVDISHKMISLAELMRSKQSDVISNKLQFHQCDIRNYPSKSSPTTIDASIYVQYYDIVISIFHVFSYLLTNKDIEEGLHTAAKHLKPGGLLIFDCWYGPAVLTDRPVNRSKTMSHPNGSIKVNRDSTVNMRPNENIVEVNQTIKVISYQTENNEPIIRYFSEQHRLRYYFLPELKQALQHAGFNIDTMKTMEWMSKNDLSFNTWYATIIITKK